MPKRKRILKFGKDQKHDIPKEKKLELVENWKKAKSEGVSWAAWSEKARKKGYYIEGRYLRDWARGKRLEARGRPPVLSAEGVEQLREKIDSEEEKGKAPEESKNHSKKTSRHSPLPYHSRERSA